MRVCKLLMVVFVVRDMAKFVCGGEMPPTKDTPPPENSTVCLLFLHKFLERKQTAQLYATIRGNHICLRNAVPQHFFCLSGLQLYLNKIQYIAAHFYIISRKLAVVFSFSRFSCWLAGLRLHTGRFHLVLLWGLLLAQTGHGVGISIGVWTSLFGQASWLLLLLRRRR